jgi:S-layer homology domain
VSAPDDNVVRGGVYTGTLTHLTTSSFAGYSGKTWDVYSASVTDNDTPSFTLSQTGMTLWENGGTGIFTVVLDTAPIGDVVLTPSSNTGHVTTSPSSLTFTPLNWNTPQNVTITGVDDFSDTLLDDTGSVIVSVNTGSSNIYWSGAVSRSLIVTATDDDTAGYMLSTTGVTATEWGSTGSYTLRLTSLPESAVTVTLTGWVEVTPSPSSIIFTGGNWNILQTITVTAVDDSKIEGAHTGAIVHTLSSTAFGYSGMTLSGVAVDVTDNDAPSIIISQNIFTGVTDSGGTVAPTIRLGAQPTSDVVLSLSSANPLKLALSTTGMTFTTANWNTPQLLTLTTQTDADALYDTTLVTVRVLTGSSDASYSWVTSQTISVSVLDTDDTDGDGVKDSIENAGPNGGDGNGDGTLDSTQQNVTTIQNPMNSSYATLTASGGGCNFIDQPQIVAESTLSRADSTHDYPLGLARFRLLCTTTGATTQVELIYPGIYTTSAWTYRKYYTPTTTFTDLTATGMFSTGSVGTGVVTKVIFSLTDGSLATDEDTLADRYIQDPSGPSVLAPVVSPSSGGGGGAGSSVSTSASITTTTPVKTPSVTSTPSSVQFLSTQSLATPTGKKNADGYERYTIKNRITDVVCPEIVKVFGKENILASDIPSNFSDDVNAVLMFRWIEKDEKNTNQVTFAEYKKWGVGINDESYEPSRNVTRAEFVKMLVRSLSCRYVYEGDTTPFSDISPDMWYAEYINYAVNHNWLSGYADGTFRPDSPITRGEAAKILANAIELETDISISSFQDVPSTSVFVPYIEALKSSSVVSWKTPTTYEPNSYITRAEVARIIYKTFLGGERQ